MCDQIVGNFLRRDGEAVLKSNIVQLPRWSEEEKFRKKKRVEKALIDTSLWLQMPPFPSTIFFLLK